MTGHADSRTWAEMMSQPAVWREWGRELAEIAPDLRAWIAGCGADEIWLSGAGSSSFVGDLAVAALGGAGGAPLLSVPSTDLVADPRRLAGRKPLVVSFGRSGESAESRGVLAALDALAPDAPRLNVTCSPGSALARGTGARGKALVLPDSANDSGFAMTASFTAMALTSLALLDPAEPDPAERMDALAERAEALLAALPEMVEAAPMPDRIAFLGSGPLRVAAREAALKVLELTGGRVAALWDSTLGFRHGPKSFVTPGTDLVLMRSSDPYAARYDLDLERELAEQFPEARRLVIGPGGDLGTGGADDGWGAVLRVLHAQAQGTAWAARLGLDPDDPFRGLGTLTRVVADVALHDPRDA